MVKPKVPPTWVGRVVVNDDGQKVYEVIRIRPVSGYPDPPQVEGRITYAVSPQKDVT